MANEIYKLGELKAIPKLTRHCITPCMLQQLCMRYKQTTLLHGGHVHILALGGAIQADDVAKRGDDAWHVSKKTVSKSL